ncbi:hypothetical protein U9M48_004891, partial [Paspalum notatum var. saurae]
PFGPRKYIIFVKKNVAVEALRRSGSGRGGVAPRRFQPGRRRRAESGPGTRPRQVAGEVVAPCQGREDAAACRRRPGRWSRHVGAREAPPRVGGDRGGGRAASGPGRRRHASDPAGEEDRVVVAPRRGQGGAAMRRRWLGRRSRRVGDGEAPPRSDLAREAAGEAPRRSGSETRRGVGAGEAPHRVKAPEAAGGGDGVKGCVECELGLRVYILGYGV